jgi:hypothetical protein
MDEKYHANRPLAALFQDAKDAENHYFLFTVERTVNRNHLKLCFIWFGAQSDTILNEPIIRLTPHVILNYPARRAWVYFFSTPQRKEIRKDPLWTLRLQRSPAGAGQAGG